MGDLARPDLLDPLIHLADGVVQWVADSYLRGGAFVLVVPERIAHDERRPHPGGKARGPWPRQLGRKRHPLPLL